MSDSSYSDFIEPRRGKSRQHTVEVGASKSGPALSAHSCNLCKINFSNRSNLERHSRHSHGASVQTPKSNPFSCTECNGYYRTYSSIISHYGLSHPAINIKEEKLSFATRLEFQEWKDDMERNTTSSFVAAQQGSHSKVKTATCTYEYYSCHRSGSLVSNVSERKRSIKLAGSLKIGKFCPARITIHTRVGGTVPTVEVKFTSTHLGHECNPGRLVLSKTEKDVLAGQLLLGVTKERVLENAQKKFSPTKRFRITTRKDLHNIVQQYGIKYDTVLGKNDALSVEAWVQKQKGEDDNPILFYKPQNIIVDELSQLRIDDFVLCIMTKAQEAIFSRFGNDVLSINSTHGTNKYNIELTSIVVRDDNFEGFPVAFMFSNRQAKEVLVAFFHAINERVTCPPKPRSFMSDDAPALYNAWEEIFGPVEFHLLCDWQVKQAWSQNISKIVEKDKQEDAYGKLLAMLQERDETAFQILLEENIKSFLIDPDTAAFGKYFESKYAGRPKLWACCYRKKAAINTNMVCERWHKDLKYYSDLNGKQGGRLDKAIHNVMKSLRKKTIERMTSIQRGKLSHKVMDIWQRHKMSIELSADFLIQDTANPTNWTVSSTSMTELYEVIKVLGMEECKCSLRCEPCNACIHSFECSCHDYQISCNMCKHIHLVCRVIGHHRELAEVDSESTGDLIITDVDGGLVNKMDALTAELKESKHQSIDELDTELNGLISKVIVIKAMSTHEEKSALKESLKAMISRWEANQHAARLAIIPETFPRCPANKKIEQQLTLYSTKKKAPKRPRIQPVISEHASVMTIMQRQQPDIHQITENMVDSLDLGLCEVSGQEKGNRNTTELVSEGKRQRE